MSVCDGFMNEFQKTGGAKSIAKAVGLAAAGAAAGAGGTHLYAEKKRKKQLSELAGLFREANATENRIIAQKAFQAGRRG